MDQCPCVHCGRFFRPRNRRQNYCSAAGCQRARRAAWQRFKMKTDADYRTQQRLSHQKWLKDHPNYWRGYRQRNPDKTERNRTLQHIRNRRRTKPARSLIAKMDVRKAPDFNLLGQFYLVPVIAKMDVRKVTIYTIPDS